MLLRYIIWAFVFYWFFRFVFNFLVPVFRSMRQMKDQVRDFQKNMSGQGNYQGAGNNFNKTAAPKEPPAKPKTGDYIDFEEIK